MITAQQSRWAHAVFRPYLHHILHRSFYAVRLINEMPQLNPHRSLCLCPNHISWWDGFFLYFLSEKIFSRQIYCMMREDQLRRFSFFKNLGAYSIDSSDKNSLRETTSYTVSLLNNPHNGVVIFPQGAIRPHDETPRKSGKGLMHFTENTGTQILPLALRIEWYNRQKPVLLIRFGSILDAAEISGGMENFTGAFNANIGLLDAAACSENFSKEFLL